MKTSAVADLTRSTAFTQSGKMAMDRVWHNVAVVGGSFYLNVRVDRHGKTHHTLIGNSPLLDLYYGKVAYRLRVYPALHFR